MKKIYKIEEGKKICGVCGGLAEYMDVDPTLIRVLWLIAAIFAGAGLIAYLVCAIVFPNKSEVVKSDGEDKSEK